MSKFRAKALKVEDGSPLPVASTSSIILEDRPSTSPSRVYVLCDPVKMHDDPMGEVRPSPAPFNDVKLEDDDQLPRLSSNAEDPLQTKSEPSTSTSPSTSPKPESTPLAEKRPLKKGPQLIGHLSVATEEAMRTFVEIQENHYQYSTLGRSREALESMTCECPSDGSGESHHISIARGWREIGAVCAQGPTQRTFA